MTESGAWEVITTNRARQEWGSVSQTSTIAEVLVLVVSDHVRLSPAVRVPEPDQLANITLTGISPVFPVRSGRQGR